MSTSFAFSGFLVSLARETHELKYEKRFDHWQGRDKHQVSREYQKEAPNLVCGEIRLDNHQFYLNLILSPVIFIMNKIKENRFIFLLINE